MRYFILACFTLFINFSINFSANAQTQNIVAIVNDTPITLQDFKDRKAFLRYINNIEQLTPAAEMQLNRTTLKTLMDEQLFLQEGKKFNIKVSDKEVNDAIRKIEHDNKMSPGQFIENLRTHSINVDTLKQQIKAQLIKEQFAYGYLARDVAVNQNEVEETAKLANKELLLKLKKITALGKNNYTKIKSLKSKINNCQTLDPKLYQDFAVVEDISIKENNLQTPLKEALLKLKTGQTTEIFDDKENPNFYILCSKTVTGMSEDEYDYVANALANKKIAIQVQLYYEKLKKKAYMKVLLK